MVIWLIGLSGSGKTTLANEVLLGANKRLKNIVMLDGDIIREVFGNDLGYSIEDRLLNAKRICQLGKLLDNQGINVICSILSIFPETREWNRKNIENYYEVFIDVPIEILSERDAKGIYGKYSRGEITGVVGMDINFPIPDQPDLVIKNNKSKTNLLSHAQQIINKLH
jgi:adenylylsulfate kinase